VIVAELWRANRGGSATDQPANASLRTMKSLWGWIVDWMIALPGSFWAFACCMPPNLPLGGS